MCFSHFKEKKCPQIVYFTWREERQTYKHLRSLASGLWTAALWAFAGVISLAYEGQTLLCGYTRHYEGASFHVFNIHGRFPIKLQKVVCFCLLTLHQSASYLSNKTIDFS